MTAAACMSTPCVTVSEGADIGECVRVMEDNLIRRLPVVDRSGRCCGIIAQADLARSMDHVAKEVLRQVSQPTSDPSRHRRQQ
jgi:CBS-domain-containing membrane protein